MEWRRMEEWKNDPGLQSGGMRGRKAPDFSLGNDIPKIVFPG